MQLESPSKQFAQLFGLVLAGGNSRRMGADKGALEYRGVAHAVYLRNLLAAHCKRVYASINPDQATSEPYAGLAVIIDPLPRVGPATGLLAARQAQPDIAWLAVAVDLALLDERTIGALVNRRRPSAAATAFRNRDGIIEPLCAIWEPAGLALLAEHVSAGDSSPRRCLESADVEIVPCPNLESLLSVDSPAARHALLDRDRREG